MESILVVCHDARLHVVLPRRISESGRAAVGVGYIPKRSLSTQSCERLNDGGGSSIALARGTGRTGIEPAEYLN